MGFAGPSLCVAERPDDLTVLMVSFEPLRRSVATLELDAELLVFLCSELELEMSSRVIFKGKVVLVF